MFCVGLTGNIASGKSTVAKYFAELGVTVISADEISRQLTLPSQPAFQKIINHFGEIFLTQQGTLNRRALGQLIFNDAQERNWLEQLLHPLILQQIEYSVQQCQSLYCVIEIPLLPNRLNYPYLNRVLLVLADPEQQITRLMVRDHHSREHALAIMATQANEQSQRMIADDILMNDQSLTELHQKVLHLHAYYLKLACV